MQTGTWLRWVRSKEKQEGLDHHELVCDPYKLTVRTRKKILQAMNHVHRALALVPLPMEEDAQQRRIWEENRQAYVRELALCAEGIAAALTAVACTDREIEKVLESTEVTAEVPMPPPMLPAPVRRCSICKTPVTGTPGLSRVLPAGVVLCGEEECEEKYDGTQTVQFTVLKSSPGTPEKNVQ